ncbi:MAG: PEGA domain-containing protein [Lacipirellulaceae bacterium]
MFATLCNAARRPAWRRLALVGLAAAMLLPTGCVRRRLLVRSNPVGATVHIDNQLVGVTPCALDYVYYGTREVRLSAPGYETLTVNQPIPTPWYEYPGLDFISENMVPTTINDTRTISFNLSRERMAPAEEVIARGEELRRAAAPTGVAPLGAMPMGPPAPLGGAPAQFVAPPPPAPPSSLGY